MSSLLFSSRLLGLDPSLPSRGFVGVAGTAAPDAAAAATAAVLEDGRGGASPVSLVRETMVWTGHHLVSPGSDRIARVSDSMRSNIIDQERRQEPGDRSWRSCQQNLAPDNIFVSLETQSRLTGDKIQ